MPSPHQLILFDLDGTLLLSGGAGARALNTAFESLYGVPEAMAGIDPHGKTDPFICQEMFRAHLGREGAEEEATEILRRYLDYLPDEVAQSEKYRLMPGVPDILDFLVNRDKISLGLGTGNIEGGARAKLERGGLNRFFPFGGFASDAALRADLIEAGFRRGEERIQEQDPKAEIIRWVIGDTWRDVEAGKAAGARTVAVATGGDSLEALSGTEPDYLFPDLAGSDAWGCFENGMG